MNSTFIIGEVVRCLYDIEPWLTRGQKYIVINRPNNTNNLLARWTWVIDDTGAHLNWPSNHFELVIDD